MVTRNDEDTAMQTDTAFWIGLCKPKASSTWLPLTMHGGNPIISMSAEKCEERCSEWLEHYVRHQLGNMYKDPNEWEYASGEVTV